MCALKLPAHAATHARDIIAHHDFSSARAHLVPSIPGYHTGPATAVPFQADQVAYSQNSGLAGCCVWSFVISGVLQQHKYPG